MSSNTFNDKFYVNAKCSLTIVGGLFLFKKSLNATFLIKKYFLTRRKNFHKAYGKGWTLITGGSEGLGKSYAKEFYKRGHNVLIISRSEEKLKYTKSEIENSYTSYNNHFNNKVEYLVYDFSKEYSAENISSLNEQLKEYEFNILINNVGTVSLDHIDKISDENIKNIININLMSNLILTKYIMQKMKNRKDKSLIVSIGSDLIHFNPPFLQIYNATKSFMHSLSKSLEKETDKIDYTHILPGPLETSLNPRKIMFKVEADDYANSSINHFGNYSESYGHYKHLIKNLILGNPFVFYLYTENSLKKEFKPKND